MVIDKIKPYSIALFELARDQKNLDKIYKEIKFIKQCISLKYLEILQSNFLKKEKRHELLDKSLGKKFDILLINFLKYLIDQNVIYKLFDIFDYYNYLYNDYSGIKFANVYSVELLSEKNIKQIKKLLYLKFKKNFIINNYVDKNIIGGFKVKIEDEVLDYSIQNNLINLRKSFARS